MDESLPTLGEIRNPEVVTHAELDQAQPGTRLSIVVDKFFSSHGGPLEGLHHIEFVKIGPQTEPDAWKDGPHGQGWFQDVPGYGRRPAHINGSRRTDGELVKGENFDFVVYDILDPQNADEVARMREAGAMILEEMPKQGTWQYDHLKREGLHAVADPQGDLHWRIMQEHTQGRVVSMQLEAPQAAPDQIPNATA